MTATTVTRDLAFGLVTYNSGADLAQTLPATVRVARELGAEVLVWDNASQDDSVSRAEALGATRIARSPVNAGFAAGVNGLFAMAGERDLLLLNPDVELGSADQVRRLTERLTDDVGVVAPALRNPDGSLQQSARQFPTVAGMAGRASVAQRTRAGRRAAARYTALPESDAPVDVDWAIGAALLISSDANRQVSGWDEGYFLYLEDVDFCFRLARAQWRTIYDPAVELTHTHHRASAETSSLLPSKARRHHIRSALRFFLKYGSLAPRPVVGAAGGPTAPQRAATLGPAGRLRS